MGLYYSELINNFPESEWDNNYGWIACAYAPYNVLVPALVPLMELRERNGSSVRALNGQLCHLFYLPACLMEVTLVFLAIDVLLAPFAYGYQII